LGGADRVGGTGVDIIRQAPGKPGLDQILDWPDIFDAR
jgi:hypothetical protein